MNARERPAGASGTGLENLREVALRAVNAATTRRVFLADALKREFDRAEFPPTLRSAASELASGIVRRRITLDHLLADCSDRTLRRVNPLLLDILRLAAYEILFVPRVPPRASVSEAVNLARKLVQPAVGGFANAVLRKLTGSIDSRDARPSSAPTRRELTTPDGRAVKFNRHVFPDPEGDPAGYLSSAGGMPRWIVDRWLRNLGPSAAFNVTSASNSVPPVTIRVNALRTDPETLRASLAERGIETIPGSVEGSLRVIGSVELSALPEFESGDFYIQDESAMRGPRLLGPKPADKILDLCAAPGGKATHLADLSGDRAEIYALDQSADRMMRVEANARRLGIQRLRTAVGDARKVSDKGKGWFHAALADVPCSNTGVLRRRVDARHRLTGEGLAELVEVQAEILRAALDSVRLGGRVVYSTCSIEPEENGELVRRVLAGQDVWRLDVEELLLPRADGPDGGYVARIISDRPR
jgi:16S rRNA (cytosine967-C5)-methyltransferase